MFLSIYPISSNLRSKNIYKPAFKGKFLAGDNEYKYVSRQLSKAKDVITYSKDDGVFLYNSKKLSCRYNPITKEEVCELRSNEGTVIKTTSPTKEIMVEKDSKGTVDHFFELNKENNSSKEYTFDRVLNREITTVYENGETSTTVYDRDKGEYVTKGEKTWEIIDDKKEKKITVKNIVNNNIVKEQSYDPQNRYTKEYYEDSGIIKHEFYLDKNQTKQTNIDHDETGKITKHTITETMGRCTKKTTMVPNTEKIEKITFDYIDRKANASFHKIDMYRFEPNTVALSKTFNSETKQLVEETQFYKDGRTVKSVIRYNPDGSNEEQLYDEKNHLTRLSQRTSSGFLKLFMEYYPNTNKKVRKVIEANPDTKESKEYKYDLTGDNLEAHYYKDSEGKLVESALYYKGLNQISVKYEYKDNLCIETHYDKDGNVLKISNIAQDKASPKINDALNSNEEDFVDMFRELT